MVCDTDDHSLFPNPYSLPTGNQIPMHFEKRRDDFAFGHPFVEAVCPHDGAIVFLVGLFEFGEKEHVFAVKLGEGAVRIFGAGGQNGFRRFGNQRLAVGGRTDDRTVFPPSDSFSFPIKALSIFPATTSFSIAGRISDCAR